GLGCIAGSHHRAGRGRDLSADERQFRPIPPHPRPDQEGRPQEDVHRPRARGAARLAQLSSAGAPSGASAGAVRAGGQSRRTAGRRLTAVVANSAAFIVPDLSWSAVANLVVALIAHSSKLSLPSPSRSSLA